jgi:glycosyltransferase involved in cell wall biosynthesis
MTTRVLHVLDTCAAGGIETTFLNVLRTWHAEPAWAEHRLLAFAGGTLAREFGAAGAGLTIAESDDEAAACLLGDYEVVHFLFDRVAYRWLPLVAAESSAGLVYGKGYDLAGTFRLAGAPPWQPDDSMMWACDMVTFTTGALAAAYDTPASRTTVLGKAADVTGFNRVPPPADGLPDRIVCVANLHALKRLEDLVQATARLRPAHPTLRLRFVGADTGEGERLRRAAEQCGVADICEWAGRREDVAAELAESRIFALPSGREGVPTAMIEAMAAGRPVVVTDVGHVRSVLRDGIEGYLVPVGAVGLLAARLGWLLADRSRAAAMGAAGRERAATHDVSKIAGALRDALTAAATSAGVSGVPA